MFVWPRLASNLFGRYSPAFRITKPWKIISLRPSWSMAQEGLAIDDPIVLPVPYGDVPHCLKVFIAGSMGLHAVSSLRSIDIDENSPRKEDL